MVIKKRMVKLWTAAHFRFPDRWGARNSSISIGISISISSNNIRVVWQY